MKRHAAHYVYHPEKGYLKQHVVEVERGIVLRMYPLTEEIEDVEWHPGVIVLVPENFSSRLVPYLLYPFDFKTMQPVGGTRRKRLQ